VFYINLPFGLLSALLIGLLVHENVERRKHQIDYLGSAALTAGVTALLWAFLQGGKAWAWDSPQSIGTFGVSAALLALFIWNEGRAPEPVLPLSLFRNRIIAVASLAGALSGAIMYGVTSYVPLLVQGVQGGSASDAGTVVAPMSLGWPVGSIIAGRLIVRSGYRLVVLIGGVCMLAGGLMLLLIGEEISRVLLVTMLVLIGMGLGFTSSAFVIAIQNAVSWSQRGIATATTQFFRTIGGSIGVAVLGAMLTARWRANAEARVAGTDFNRASDILDPAKRDALPLDALAGFQHALADGLHSIYGAVAALSVVVFLVILFFPRGSADELAGGAEDVVEGEAEPAPFESGLIAGG
jgi:MFS family permease